MQLISALTADIAVLFEYLNSVTILGTRHDHTRQELPVGGASRPGIRYPEATHTHLECHICRTPFSENPRNTQIFKRNCNPL